MLIYQGKEYYPLDIDHLEKDGKTYYDRNSRKKNYFYLDLRTGKRDPEPEKE